MSLVRRTPPPESKTHSNLLTTPLTSTASDPELHVISDDQDLATRRIKRKLSHNISVDSSSVLCQMKDMFKEFESQQNTKFEKLIESVLIIKDQNTEIQKSMDFLSSKYDEVLEKVHGLEQKNKSYELKIESLESKIEQLERNSRSAMIELRNVPKQDSENKLLLSNIVKKVGEVIQQPISTSDIQDVFRLKTSKETNNHIVVNFSTIEQKNGFIKQCRSFNKANRDSKLSTSHLNLSGPNKPIYVDESLTPLARRLSFLARQSVKDHGYHSTWSSYGKIFIRLTQNSPPVRIDSEDDIEKLMRK